MSKSTVLELLGKLNLKMRRSVPKVMQTEAAECGLASLAMISSYFGKDIDLFSLRQRYGISSNGVNLKQLIDVATQMQLKTRPLALDLNELKALKTPCILHWDLSHFVVLISVRRNKVTIHDPAFGRRVLGIKEVSLHFTGVALELWPSTEFTPETKRSRLQLFSLMKNIDGLKGFLLKLFFFSALIEAVNILLPIGTQLVMDHVIVAEDHDLLTLICLGLLFFILFRTFIGVLRSWITIVTNSLINVQWSSSLFEHLVRLPLNYFEKRKLGDVQSRFSSLDVVRKTFTSGLVNSVMDSIMSISVLVMMFLYGGWLVWVVLGFTVVYIAMRLLTYNYYRQASEELIIKEAKANSHFMETLYGINTLKALSLSKIRSSYWLNLKIDAINADIRITKFDMIFGGISTFIATIDQVIILWLGASMVIDNNMTLGMFVAFNAYRGQFSERAVNLVDMLLQLRMLTLHCERIADIAFSEPEQESQSVSLIKPGEKVSVNAKELTFQYDKISRPIFSDLNISISPGESVAIIGPSGAGKTTLLKILAGLLTPTSGNVTMNGIDIQQAGVNNYRQYIACVLQDDKLFAGSIAENIAGFDTEIDYEFVVECAKRCNMDEEITRMPMGYQTLIGELGGNLSGGQKQRLLIARALYRKPDILFMDEATSHLDTDNESHINSAISELNVTRIIVAHRQSTIESADRIIELG